MERGVIRGVGLAVVVTGAGIAIARHRRQAPFYAETRRGTPELYGSVRLAMPFHFRHSHGFASLHEASFDAVQEALPSRELRPVRLPDGRALILVSAFRHGDITDASNAPTTPLCPPTGEVDVAAVVTRGPQHTVRTLATIAGVGTRPLETFVLHMPITNLQMRDAGRRGWGMPKFVADMDFDDDPAMQRVRVSEAGEHILTLTLRPGGWLRVARTTVEQYDVLDGALVRTDIVSHGHLQAGFGGATLELGINHPVAADLRRLDLALRALASTYMPALRTIANAPVRIGDARPHEGYLGAEREYGRFTVRYPGTGPLDQYASPPASPTKGRPRRSH